MLFIFEVVHTTRTASIASKQVTLKTNNIANPANFTDNGARKVKFSAIIPKVSLLSYAIYF